MTAVARRVIAGALAGAVGTVAMDLVWYNRYSKDGGTDNFADWEFATSVESFEEAGAPGQLGKKFADAAGVDLPDSAAGTTTNVMHWLTGIGYGLGHALTQHHRGAIRGGLNTGAGAFANSYLSLGLAGIYDPIWTYSPATLAKDLSAHQVFGLATGLAYRLLRGSRD